MGKLGPSNYFYAKENHQNRIKPIVTYQRCAGESIHVGSHALVFGVTDHPKVEATVVSTSIVIKVEPDGTFETLNTIYKPLV